MTQPEPPPEAPISVEELTNALIAANPCPPGADAVAHAYELLGDAEAAMPVVAVAWPLAVAEGRRQVVQVIADRLAVARTERRLPGPTERRGRITALGQLLEELEGASE